MGGLGDAMNALESGAKKLTDNTTDTLKDLTPDPVEDKVEGAIEGGGELLRSGADAAAGKMDDWGWHKAADYTRKAGDYVSNKTGGNVPEDQLGETEEANKLIHGSPSKLRSTAKHLKDFDKAFTAVGKGLKALDSAHLKGEAADAFRASVDVQPPRWFKAADACEKAGTALEDFAGTVKWAQSEARKAIRLYKKAKAASEAHRGKVDAYNDAVDKYNATAADERDPDSLPDKPPATDPGKAKMDEAQETLHEARRQRDEAARAAVKAVEAAREAAPPKPSYRAQARSGVKGNLLGAEHLVAGLVKGGAGLLNWSKQTSLVNPYNITHPGEYVTNLNSTANGLITAAKDPKKFLKSEWSTFLKDPQEYVGTFIAESALTGGSGKAAGLARKAARTAEGTGRKAVKHRGPGENTTPPKKKCSDGTDPVDLATGKMYLPQTDVSLPGALPLVFRRQVESGYRVGRWFGPSWSSTADQRLEIDAEGVVFVSEDGLLLSYPHPAPDVTTLPEAGPRWPLERDPHGDYTLTDPATGHVRHFAGPLDVDPGGDGVALLEQISDRSGHWITFEYDAEGTPTALAHSAGYELKLSTAEGRITALHLAGAAEDGGDQELIRYAYTDGNLTGVTGSSGLPLRFEYDEERRVIAWVDTNDRRYDYAYDNQDRCIA
ncbi:putative T7SS-secreted protein, partial [Streptomyces sp. BRA346]|uniref:putative T7SS-secreted protein n=1 Tax=Streptomyces sp. BRA346 TaxID=2878199 RepID=UPI004063826D